MNQTHTFLVGGFTGGSDLSDAHMFDWTSEDWIELPNKPSEASFLGCALYNGSIMVTGKSSQEGKKVKVKE